MNKLQDLFNQAKQAVKTFISSRTRVAVLFAVVAAIVGAVLLLPPPANTTNGLAAGEVQTVASDAGSAVAVDTDASVVIDLPPPASTDGAANAADATVATDEDVTCSQ